MKILLSILSLILVGQVHAETSADLDGNDRFCGTIRVLKSPPPSCPTCTPAFEGHVLDATSFFSLKGGEVPVSKTLLLGRKIQGYNDQIESDLDARRKSLQIGVLQSTVVRLLQLGQTYCVTGYWGDAAYKDPRAPEATESIDFRQILPK